MNVDQNLNSLGVNEILFTSNNKGQGARVSVTSGMLFVSGNALIFCRGAAANVQTLTVTVA